MSKIVCLVYFTVILSIEQINPSGNSQIDFLIIKVFLSDFSIKKINRKLVSTILPVNARSPSSNERSALFVSTKCSPAYILKSNLLRNSWLVFIHSLIMLTRSCYDSFEYLDLVP